MRLKPMSLNGLMNFAMVTGIDVTPNLYYYVAKIRIISQTSIIRQHLFGLLLLAIDKNSNKNLLSAKKESYCDISRIEMNHQTQMDYIGLNPVLFPKRHSFFNNSCH